MSNKQLVTPLSLKYWGGFNWVQTFFTHILAEQVHLPLSHYSSEGHIILFLDYFDNKTIIRLIV